MKRKISVHHVDGCRQGKILDHGYTHLRDNGLRLGQPGVEYWNPAEKTLVRVVGPKPECVDDWSLVTCRNCLAKHEKDTNAIDKLDRLQAEAGGIECVREILIYLRRGERQRAANLRCIEGDKTRTHAAVEKQLYKMFGCRLHGVQGCDKWPCRRV